MVALLRELADGELEIEGRLLDASNLALRVWVGESRTSAIYKPVRGERELWDFPDGTLAARERGSYLVSRAGGWDHIPETVLRDGPLGPGSVQRWVGPLESTVADLPVGLVRLDAVDQVPEDYLPVVGVELGDGTPMAVSHADEDRLASLAVLDAVLNNADRKASHLIEDGDRLWAIDHGVTLNTATKLRTVLWGWAGDPLREADVERLHRLEAALYDGLTDELADLITAAEIDALGARVERLLASGVFPEPDGVRHPLPWPLW